MATGMTCRSVLSACLKFSSYVVLRAIQRLTFWLDRESSWLMRVALRDVHRAGGLRLPWCLLTCSLYLCFFIFSHFPDGYIYIPLLISKFFLLIFPWYLFSWSFYIISSLLEFLIAIFAIFLSSLLHFFIFSFFFIFIFCVLFIFICFFF